MTQSIAEEAIRVAGQSPVAVVRHPSLVERVVFVGGHPGCGKSLMTAVIGSFARVEIQKYNYTLEHICSLAHVGAIDEGAATAMIRMLTDMDLYNMMMSRETNLRPSDCSSIFQNPGPWRYLRRLFLPEGAAAVERIKRTKPILHTLTHNLLVLSPPLFQALGDRIRLIELVRHPLYMVKQWYLYIERYAADARDFTICFDYHGDSLPFFARGWEEQYLGSTPMDRAIHSISHLSAFGAQVLCGLSEDEKARVMVVPFERFVLDPWPYLQQLEALLGTTVTPLTRRELKRQHVPRKMIAEAMPLPIYKQYGWEPPEKGSNERQELERRRRYAAEHATPKGMEELDRLSREYEETYLRDIL